MKMLPVLARLELVDLAARFKHDMQQAPKRKIIYANFLPGSRAAADSDHLLVPSKIFSGRCMSNRLQQDHLMQVAFGFVILKKDPKT